MSGLCSLSTSSETLYSRESCAMVCGRVFGVEGGGVAGGVSARFGSGIRKVTVAGSGLSLG